MYTEKGRIASITMPWCCKWQDFDLIVACGVCVYFCLRIIRHAVCSSAFAGKCVTVHRQSHSVVGEGDGRESSCNKLDGQSGT